MLPALQILKTSYHKFNIKLTTPITDHQNMPVFLFIAWYPTEGFRWLVERYPHRQWMSAKASVSPSDPAQRLCCNHWWSQCRVTSMKFQLLFIGEYFGMMSLHIWFILQMSVHRNLERRGYRLFLVTNWALSEEVQPLFTEQPPSWRNWFAQDGHLLVCWWESTLAHQQTTAQPWCSSETNK